MDFIAFDLSAGNIRLQMRIRIINRSAQIDSSIDLTSKNIIFQIEHGHQRIDITICYIKPATQRLGISIGQYTHRITAFILRKAEVIQAHDVPLINHRTCGIGNRLSVEDHACGIQRAIKDRIIKIAANMSIEPCMSTDRIRHS